MLESDSIYLRCSAIFEGFVTAQIFNLECHQSFAAEPHCFYDTDSSKHISHGQLDELCVVSVPRHELIAVCCCFGARR